MPRQLPFSPHLKVQAAVPARAGEASRSNYARSRKS